MMENYHFCVSKKLESWLSDVLACDNIEKLFDKLTGLVNDKNGVTCNEVFRKKVELNIAMKNNSVTVETAKRRGYTIVYFKF